MSTNRSSSGVRNLRAMFEDKEGEARSTSPSRRLSSTEGDRKKVTASFVPVEQSGGGTKAANGTMANPEAIPPATKGDAEPATQNAAVKSGDTNSLTASAVSSVPKTNGKGAATRVSREPDPTRQENAPKSTTGTAAHAAKTRTTAASGQVTSASEQSSTSAVKPKSTAPRLSTATAKSSAATSTRPPRPSLNAQTAASAAKSKQVSSDSADKTLPSRSKPRSPTRPAKLSSHLTAPTAASSAKHGDAKSAKADVASPRPSLGGLKASTSTIKTSTRSDQASARPQARESIGRPSTGGESFLSRMMRPTASSASKAHERTDGKTQEKAEPKVQERAQDKVHEKLHSLKQAATKVIPHAGTTPTTEKPKAEESTAADTSEAKTGAVADQLVDSKMTTDKTKADSATQATVRNATPASGSAAPPKEHAAPKIISNDTPAGAIHDSTLLPAASDKALPVPAVPAPIKTPPPAPKDDAKQEPAKLDRTTALEKKQFVAENAEPPRGRPSSAKDGMVTAAQQPPVLSKADVPATADSTEPKTPTPAPPNVKQEDKVDPKPVAEPTRSVQKKESVAEQLTDEGAPKETKADQEVAAELPLTKESTPVSSSARAKDETPIDSSIAAISTPAGVDEQTIR